ncbi:MAG: hypothetical protein HQK89_06025 [Nitrospirae bacterium]|nr:hypothetical protein [Nitrospirota bacterium]
MVVNTYAGNDKKLRLYRKTNNYSNSLQIIVSLVFIIASTVCTASICTASIQENQPQPGHIVPQEQIVSQEQDVIAPPPGQTMLLTEKVSPSTIPDHTVTPRPTPVHTAHPPKNTPVHPMYPKNTPAHTELPTKNTPANAPAIYDRWGNLKNDNKKK